MRYQTGIMSSKIELEAETIDEAIAVTILYYTTSGGFSGAPIAVYNSDEKSSLYFPYKPEEIDNVLEGMGERLKKAWYGIDTLL